MSSDLATIDLQTSSRDTEALASGVWIESVVNRPTPWRLRIIAPIAGMILAIAASPAMAIPDYWFSRYFLGAGENHGNHPPAVDQDHHKPHKGTLIGGSGCRKGHPKDCELCPLPDCEWTGEWNEGCGLVRKVQHK